MSRGRERLLKGLAIGMAVVGLCLVGLYAWSVYSVLDSPDQSLIFWHSPFLMFGLFLLGAAVAFAGLARIMRRENASRHRQATGTPKDGQE